MVIYYHMQKLYYICLRITRKNVILQYFKMMTEAIA